MSPQGASAYRQQFLEVLTAATNEVFSTMSFLDVLPEEPIADAAEIDGLDISAVICMAGEISGLLAIHCSRKFAAECAQLISGQDGEFSERELGDTISEIANMIAGTFKRSISARLDLFDISLPIVMLSGRHRLYYTGAKANFPRLLVPFSMDGDKRFYVELIFHKR